MLKNVVLADYNLEICEITIIFVDILKHYERGYYRQKGRMSQIGETFVFLIFSLKKKSISLAATAQFSANLRTSAATTFLYFLYKKNSLKKNFFQRVFFILERETRLELATSTLARLRSTN